MIQTNHAARKCRVPRHTDGCAVYAIELRWRIKPDALPLSCQHAVEDFDAEYARRYRLLMHTAAEAQTAAQE